MWGNGANHCATMLPSTPHHHHLLKKNILNIWTLQSLSSYSLKSLRCWQSHEWIALKSFLSSDSWLGSDSGPSHVNLTWATAWKLADIGDEGLAGERGWLTSEGVWPQVLGLMQLNNSERMDERHPGNIVTGLHLIMDRNVRKKRKKQEKKPWMCDGGRVEGA